MPVKMLSCFGSSKCPKRELMWEPALQRGLLWKNVHYIERNPSSELVKGTSGKSLCQELLIHLTSPSQKLEYMPTDRGHQLPLTLATCHAEWDDYLDLTKTVTEMAHHLMKEHGQEVAAPPKAACSQVTNDWAPLVITLSISETLLMHQLWVCSPERTMTLTMRPSYWATLAMPCKRWPPV